MATVAALTLLSITQAVFGRPIEVDVLHELGNELSPVVVSRFSSTVPCYPCSPFRLLSIQSAPETTQTVYIHSMDALVRPEGLFETPSASRATMTPAALLGTVDASTTAPAAISISKSAIALAVIIPLVALVISLVAWTARKTRRRAASLAAPTPVSPQPLITSIRVVAVTEVPAKVEEDKTMRSVRDFWSPISPGPPELHVEYKNLEVAIGTAVDPVTTHLALLPRDESGFFYDSDHPPASPGTGNVEYTLKSPPPVDRDVSDTPEAGHADEASHHEPISMVPVVDNAEIRTPPQTPKLSSSPDLHSLETPKKGSRGQRSVLGTANQVPVIRIIEATPERSEKKSQGYSQRFNSRAITPRQARLQNLI